jgi:hypothetical protein
MMIVRQNKKFKILAANLILYPQKLYYKDEAHPISPSRTTFATKETSKARQTETTARGGGRRGGARRGARRRKLH